MASTRSRACLPGQVQTIACTLWKSALHTSFSAAPSWVSYPMLRIVYMLAYGAIWIFLGLKHVVEQIASIIWLESVSLFGKSPSASDIQQATKGLKKWNHLGCVLDHTHFGRNGMLSSAAIAKLGAICVACDSSHTSIFLPRRTNLLQDIYSYLTRILN